MLCQGWLTIAKTVVLVYFSDMSDIKERTKIVLVHPDDSGNIGAVCRSMKTMGLHHLIIADPQKYDEHTIEYRAVHAFDIYQNAQFFPTLKEALAGTAISVGTSRRTGKKRKYRTFLPEEMCDSICQMTEGDVAIVFGNEEHGLTDDELAECNAVVSIPTSDEFPSLNLSHAVQIMCYQLFRSSAKRLPKRNFTPLSSQRMDEICSHLIENFRSLGFFKIDRSEEMQRFFRDIFSRAMMCREEADKLDKIFTKVAGIKSKIDADKWKC